jgi:hypothetical protein
VLGDDGSVALDVSVGHVVEETAATADHHQQATTGVVVCLVLFQVIVQLVDAGSQDRNLDLGRTGVGLVEAMLGYDGGPINHGVSDLPVLDW